MDQPTLKESNRRFNLRVEMELPIVVLMGRDNPHPHACHTADVSAGGVKIVTTRRLPWPSNVIVAFKLPGSEETIAANGTVVRRRLHDDGMWRVGIRFVDLDPEVRARIGRFVVQALGTGLGKAAGSGSDDEG